jgi:16S rRNA (adenine1518-N6/adenine1519-N6)-dimethyltransferase
MSYVQQILSPSGIIRVLTENNLSLKERFGQNLLINRTIASNIIEKAEVRRGDTVLEIGPGLGALTFLIAERARTVIAYEVDRGFARLLDKKAWQLGYGNIQVVEGDFLRADCSLLEESGVPSRAISNFPYSIAIRAIIKIIEELPAVVRITGTVQEEIAQRITAKPGAKNYSYVSVYLQYIAKIEVSTRSISPSNFFPKPEVRSAIVDLTPARGEFPVGPEFFKSVVRTGFSSRRKSLVNNLSSLSGGVEKERLRAVVREIYDDEQVRAENLSVEDFIMLCKRLAGYRWYSPPT